MILIMKYNTFVLFHKIKKNILNTKKYIMSEQNLNNNTKHILTNRLYFRAWNEELKLMSKPFTFGQVLNFNDKYIKSLTNEVVLRFTGRKDRNGNEICEGDIVRAKTVDVIHPQDSFKIKEEYITSSVYWDKYNCSFETDFNCFSFSDSENIEIIGNIYELTQTTS